jgi:hypothetical protein
MMAPVSETLAARSGDGGGKIGDGGGKIGDGGGDLGQ